jgi:hypothetical protein
MIIKSHVRGGYRAAANYLKQTGDNEKVRLVEFSDSSVKDLDEAFRNMWMVGKTTRARKPLHHVSINPYKDERLADAQVFRICACLEEKYGYRHGDHQRVIVEHVKDGRQHFHVMWNRVSLRTGRPVWPGHHWNKSKQAAREMEVELGLKRPVARRKKGGMPGVYKHARPLRRPGKGNAICRRFRAAKQTLLMSHPRNHLRISRPAVMPPPRMVSMRRRHSAGKDDQQPEAPIFVSQPMSREELIAWAWENQRADILALFGIYVTFDL